MNVYKSINEKLFDQTIKVFCCCCCLMYKKLIDNFISYVNQINKRSQKMIQSSVHFLFLCALFYSFTLKFIVTAYVYYKVQFYRLCDHEKPKILITIFKFSLFKAWNKILDVLRINKILTIVIKFKVGLLNFLFTGQRHENSRSLIFIPYDIFLKIPRYHFSIFR